MGFPYRFDGTEALVTDAINIEGLSFQAMPGEVYDLMGPYSGTYPFAWAGEAADDPAAQSPRPSTVDESVVTEPIADTDEDAQIRGAAEPADDPTAPETGAEDAPTE